MWAGQLVHNPLDVQSKICYCDERKTFLIQKQLEVFPSNWYHSAKDEPNSILLVCFVFTNIAALAYLTILTVITPITYVTLLYFNSFNISVASGTSNLNYAHMLALSMMNAVVSLEKGSTLDIPGMDRFFVHHNSILPTLPYSIIEEVE